MACVPVTAAYAAWRVPTPFPWEIYLPYLAGTVALVLGVIGIRKDFADAHGSGKLIVLGPMFMAVPMAVFGMEHFVFTQSVIAILPSWMPWKLFWGYLAGACLMAGALSLALRKYAWLAAALFGTMLLSFVVLIHIPNVVRAPGDRFMWAVAVRDLTFAAGSLSFAAARAPARWKRSAPGLLNVARLLIGAAVIFFSIEHFLHPEFKPGVPLRQLTPQWLPARVPLAYLTGIVFLIAGLALILKRAVKLAATSVGLMVLLLVLLFCVPIEIAQPLAIGTALNSLVDTLLLSGSVLCFAESERKMSVVSRRAAA